MSSRRARGKAAKAHQDSDESFVYAPRTKNKIE